MHSLDTTKYAPSQWCLKKSHVHGSLQLLAGVPNCLFSILLIFFKAAYRFSTVYFRSCCASKFEVLRSYDLFESLLKIVLGRLGLRDIYCLVIGDKKINTVHNLSEN